MVTHVTYYFLHSFSNLVKSPIIHGLPFFIFLIGLLEENDKTLMRSQSGSALKSKGKITNRYRWSTDLNLRVNWSTLKISCFFLLERHLGSLASDYPLEWNEGDEEALSGVVIACQLPIMIIIIMASCTTGLLVVCH